MKNSVFASTKLTTFVLMFLGLFSSAQTPQQIQKITSLYDKTYLQELANQSLQKSEKEKKAALAYAQLRNIPVSYTTEDGTYVELQQILPDGTPIYYETHNAEAARSTRTDHLNNGGSTGYNLNGENMSAYVWDGGHPRITHQEFENSGRNNRISIMDALDESEALITNHATHVIGTIAASGSNPLATGMAPQSTVNAYKWSNDLAEATLATLNGMLVSNHSYGYDVSAVPDQWFGAYIERARDWDNLMYHAPYYLMVNSAGNAGQADKNSNPLATGYDKLSGFGVSKNNIVVASVHDAEVDEYGNLISVEIAALSSQGPTDDLRIKPDIAGNGVEVYSAYAGSDTIYHNSSGTSMATPNVSGSLLLLQQHYNNENGNFMRAATLKGLALHTADNIGEKGPDAVSGWGLLNAKKAAETISQNGVESLVQELVLSQGQTISFTVMADEINSLIASISWTDRAGTVNEVLNSPIAALINDLDIRIKKDETIYHPWRLISATENSNDGDNTKDPYERVDVENASGNYTIVITHKGNLDSGSQAFSLIVTGIQEVPCYTASIPENIEVLDITGSSARILWETNLGNTYSLRYREMEDSSWIEIEDLYTNHYQLTNLTPNTEYEFQVGLKCLESDPRIFSDIHSFSTVGVSYCNSTSEDQTYDFYISNVNLNSIINVTGRSNYSDYTYLNTELVAGQTYSISLNSYAPANIRSSYSVWIDYNNDGHFDMQEEQVLAITSQANTEITGSFTVPSDINLGLTRMRVTMTAGELPVWPCETFTYGEVEDYSINFRMPTDFVYENGFWSPNNPSGVSTSSDNIHIVNGTATFTDDTEANNITVMSGAILKVENNLTIHGTMLFKSTAEGNGELAEVPESATIIGNVTVERYMSNNRSYRMVSSAVTTRGSIHDNWQEGAISGTHNPAPGFGTHITGNQPATNGFDETQNNNYSMFTVDVATQMFQAVENTNVNTLTAGEAYLLMVRGDRSINLNSNESIATPTVLRTTGSLQTGDCTQTFNAPAPTYPAVASFVMFGNPYQSAVNMKTVLAESVNVNPYHYYMYNPTLGDLGSYVTVMVDDDSTNDEDENPISSNANRYLQPGQGAQVAAISTGDVVIKFRETDKTPGGSFHTETNATGHTMIEGGILIGQLFTLENYNNGGSLHDSFKILFADGNDNEVTLKDAIKPMNFTENLGINHNGSYLSVERRAMPQDGEVYPLYSSGYQYSDYTLKLSIEGLDASSLYLEDYFMGTNTLLERGDTTYNFTVDKNDPLSVDTGRFAIRSEARLDVNDNNMLAGIRLYPNPVNDNTFYINAPNLNGKTVTLSLNDMLGREVYRAEHAFSETSLKVELSQSLSSGVYIVKLSSNGLERNLRIIKE